MVNTVQDGLVQGIYQVLSWYLPSTYLVVAGYLLGNQHLHWRTFRLQEVYAPITHTPLNSPLNLDASHNSKYDSTASVNTAAITTAASCVVTCIEDHSK